MNHREQQRRFAEGIRSGEEEPCKACDGTGIEFYNEYGQPVPCFDCDGSGLQCKELKDA